MDKTKLNLERLRAYDAEWEEDKHPRAENGQFTSGSGSAGSSSGGSNTGGSSGASGTKKYNQKDLLKLANNHLNYHLGSGETDATADKVEIVSKPDKYGNVDAKVSYNSVAKNSILTYQITKRLYLERMPIRQKAKCTIALLVCWKQIIPLNMISLTLRFIWRMKTITIKCVIAVK